MDISKEIMHGIEPQKAFSFQIADNLTISINKSIVVMWFIMVVIILLGLWLVKDLKKVPDTKKQHIAEIFIGGINNFVKDFVGHHYKKFAPYLGTLFIFLVLSNMISIFNIIPTGENLYHITGIKFFEHLPNLPLQPPTKDLNVTLALAVFTIVFTIVASFKERGAKGFFKELVDPSFILAPLKILEYFIRIISLAFRLFGNILAAFIVMEIIYMLIPFILPVPFSFYFDLFDGILQAIIFTFLSTIYFMEAVEE